MPDNQLPDSKGEATTNTNAPAETADKSNTLKNAKKSGPAKKYSPAQIKQALGPGVYIKYSDMTIWDEPDEGGPDLYIFVPELDPDDF